MLPFPSGKAIYPTVAQELRFPGPCLVYYLGRSFMRNSRPALGNAHGQVHLHRFHSRLKQLAQLDTRYAFSYATASESL